MNPNCKHKFRDVGKQKMPDGTVLFSCECSNCNLLTVLTKKELEDANSEEKE